MPETGGTDAVARGEQGAVAGTQQRHPRAFPWRDSLLLQHMFEGVMVAAFGQQNAFAAASRVDLKRCGEALRTQQREAVAVGQRQRLTAVPKT